MVKSAKQWAKEEARYQKELKETREKMKEYEKKQRQTKAKRAKEHRENYINNTVKRSQKEKINGSNNSIFMEGFIKQQRITPDLTYEKAIEEYKKSLAIEWYILFHYKFPFLIHPITKKKYDRHISYSVKQLKEMAKQQEKEKEEKKQKRKKEKELKKLETISEEKIKINNE